MDDCGADSQPIRNLFMNGRHLNVMVLITMQYPMGIPPTMHSNIDFVFILRENVMSNRKRILVIANNIKSNNITDCVFWYKAEKHPPYAAGPGHGRRDACRVFIRFERMRDPSIETVDRHGRSLAEFSSDSKEGVIHQSKL